eukprot:CAMPEP_0169268862 /NCGR_PEP_ID=MMETSP1016-20121227/48081_1 /TAXON_ID=342587 /ORGANISM="Karlodinium micrum, Strain CCMP2283" /LENGTH=39 /DNA_ID= /DNA_START= /DNA_END= /DNA_ORIENTATION=
MSPSKSDSLKCDGGFVASLLSVTSRTELPSAWLKLAKST